MSSAGMFTRGALIVAGEQVQIVALQAAVPLKPPSALTRDQAPLSCLAGSTGWRCR